MTAAGRRARHSQSLGIRLAKHGKVLPGEKEEVKHSTQDESHATNIERRERRVTKTALVSSAVSTRGK